MSVMQVYRCFHWRRGNQAWWDAKKHEDGTWHVHFHADYVPSDDWVVGNDQQLFAQIEQTHELWIASVKSFWKSRDFSA
jgi:hypothetical protein